MIRSSSLTPLHRSLIAATAGAAVALTAGTQAQEALNDGIPSDASFFTEIINLTGAPGEFPPAFMAPIGDPSGNTLTQLNIDGGGLSTGQRTYSFTEINFFAPNTLNAGNFAPNFVNSEVNLINGSLLNGAMFDAASTLNLTAGSIGNDSIINGTANATGGQFGNGTTVNGTLNLSGNALTLSVGTINTGGVVNVSENATLNLNFTLATGATLNQTGGNIRSGLTIAGTANISGGGSGLSNTGGYTVQNGGVLNLSGGLIGSAELTVEDGGILNQSGGDLGFNTHIESGGVLNVAGGDFGGTFAAGFAGIDILDGGTINFTGSEFFINGEAIDTAGGVFVIADRDVALTGTLADGSDINFTLNSTRALNDNFSNLFEAGSTVTVTVIPEPTSLALLGLGGLLLARRRRA